MNIFGAPATLGPDPASPAGTITRGVTRLLRDLGYATLTEFKLTSRRRVDVAGLERGGRFAVVEVKSSLADFRANGKWPDYRAYADRFYFAVDGAFPREALPPDVGLIVADTHAAAVLRDAPETPMNAARRRAQLLRFALTGARRVSMLTDPRP